MFVAPFVLFSVAKMPKEMKQANKSPIRHFVRLSIPFKNNLLIVPRTFETQIVKSCGKNEVPFLQQG